jgi:hypothetical protein
MTSKNNNQTFIVIEKPGTIKEVSVKTITVEELYKKCGFRKGEGFEVRNTWDNVKVGIHLYNVQLWGKIDGKANTENKYDFPPPFDTQLLFGSCALVQVDKHENLTSLTKEQWLKIYETLFGGFEDIDNEEDDESEPDELETIKNDMKTKKGGYLKDGFVVDSTSEEEILVSEESDEDSVVSDETIETREENEEIETKFQAQSDDDNIVELSGGSELEEEEYEYSSEY